TLSLPADLGVAGGHWSAPRDVTPEYWYADGRSWFSPDGRADLVLASSNTPATATWYAFDVASATASPLSHDVGPGPTTAGWSADGRAVLVVEDAYLGTPALIRTDLASGDRWTVGSMPPNFSDGLFVGG